MSKIYIGVDCQVDFIDGALANTEAANNVVYVNQTQKDCRDAGFDINWTFDTHSEDYPNTLESKMVPIHTQLNTYGWMLHPSIEAEADDGSFLKSTFGSLEMLNSMMLDDEIEKIDIIVMCGYDTDICGVSNALLLRAGLPNTRIVWLSFASAASSPNNQIAALNVMLANQIEVIDTYDEFKKLLASLD